MNLTKEEKQELFYITRKSLESQFAEKPIMFDISGKSLVHRSGVFVVLTSENKIRGLAGYIDPTLPLWKAAAQSAKLAAFKDPRFAPVQSMDLPEISITLILIGPLQEIKTIQELEISKEGLLVRLGPLNGITLAHEIKLREGAIEKTLQKIKLSPEALTSEDCKIYKFNCVYLNENKTYLNQRPQSTFEELVGEKRG